MTQPRPQVVAHYLVAQTARDMARQVFEAIMRDNEQYAMWKRLCPELTPRQLRRRFVSLLAPRLLDEARSTLAGMLTGTTAEPLKRVIYDALVLDNTVPRRNARLAQVQEMMSAGRH